MVFVQTGFAERRRDKRLGKHVLTLEFDGQFYSTLDWSLGGFGIDGYQGTAAPGNVLPVTFVLETGHGTYEQTALASVVRNDTEEQKLAATFSDLGSDAVELLDAWQTGRLQRSDAKKSPVLPLMMTY